jgi:hypothetical protein
VRLKRAAIMLLRGDHIYVLPVIQPAGKQIESRANPKPCLLLRVYVFDENTKDAKSVTLEATSVASTNWIQIMANVER